MRVNQPRSFIFTRFIFPSGSRAFSVEPQSARHVKDVLHSQQSESLILEAIQGTGRDETHVPVSATIR